MSVTETLKSITILFGFVYEKCIVLIYFPNSYDTNN